MKKDINQLPAKHLEHKHEQLQTFPISCNESYRKSIYHCRPLSLTSSPQRSASSFGLLDLFHSILYQFLFQRQLSL